MAEKEYVDRVAFRKRLDWIYPFTKHVQTDPKYDFVKSVFLRELASIPAADVRPVVTCSDCKWWTKQEASLQGRCELLQMYPTGTWFCANGQRRSTDA